MARKKPTTVDLYVELADAAIKVIEARKERPTKSEILLAVAIVGSQVIARLQAQGRL